MITGRSGRSRQSGFPQHVPHVQHDAFPQLVGGKNVHSRGRSRAGSRRRASRRSAARELRRCRRLHLHIPGRTDIIDLVGPRVGRVAHHGQDLPVEFVPHIGLFGDAIEQLRQRLVDRVDGYGARDAGVDVDVDFGVPRERKQQIVDAHIVDHDAVGLGTYRRPRLGQRRSDLYRRWDFSFAPGRLGPQVGLGLLHRSHAAASCQRGGQSQ